MSLTINEDQKLIHSKCLVSLNLSKVLSSWRWAEKITTRQAAKIFGTSAATISRIERGENCDGETLGKILKWLLSKETPPTKGAK